VATVRVDSKVFHTTPTRKEKMKFSNANKVAHDRCLPTRIRDAARARVNTHADRVLDVRVGQHVSCQYNGKPREGQVVDEGLNADGEQWIKIELTNGQGFRTLSVAGIS